VSSKDVRGGVSKAQRQNSGLPHGSLCSGLVPDLLVRLLFAGAKFRPNGTAGVFPGQSRVYALNVDERVKLQVLLTAAGYWPAVTDADFSVRLFNPISRFEVDSGFAPLGILTQKQKERSSSV
jgi:hypothetical protein